MPRRQGWAVRAANLLLRAAAMRPRVRMQAVRREDYTEEVLVGLHALANRLMAEPYAHFRVHAHANDVVHVLRRVDTDEVVGFQFWRTAPLDWPRSRVILGGKLRIVPEFRRHGLHLLSGLVFYIKCQSERPGTRFVRMSIASLFGFVAITEALADYRLFDPRERDGLAGAVRAAFVTLGEESHFNLDERTGRFHVGIVPTAETLARYPAAYFDRAAARAYAAANPDFRTNGDNLGLWFRFTPRNLLAIARAVRRRLGVGL